MARRTTADENRTETDQKETVADGGRVTNHRGTEDPAKALLEDATGL
jgi:hypothetical protein